MITTEKEIKLDLHTEKNYLTLLESLDKIKSQKKLDNYFFDTKDWSLSKSGWALRIRREEDSAVITAKGPVESAPNELTVRPEIEKTLAPDSCPVFINEGMNLSNLPEEIARSIKDTIDNKRLELKLSFTTLRTAIEYHGHGMILLLEIDKTTFPDRSVDYELEVELSDAARFEKTMIIISELFERLHISMIFQKESKFARALRKIGHNSGV